MRPQRFDALSQQPSHEEAQLLFHTRLTRFNVARMVPGLPHATWAEELRERAGHLIREETFIEQERHYIDELASAAPAQPAEFMDWFEQLQTVGPGQRDPLFPWLAAEASLEEMRWFLAQDVAGEAGFEDLLALTQVKFQGSAKLEMARNYWDEMGRGHERGIHARLLEATIRELELDTNEIPIVWESLALSNVMLAMASNRRYAYQSVGALGINEMTAPGRVVHVDRGLRRLGIAASSRTYFSLHSTLDVKHSKSWNDEVIMPLITAQPNVTRAIAEGALMRLNAGARCFKRYRERLLPEG